MLRDEMHWPLRNFGVGGFTCADAAPAIYTQRVNTGDVFTFMLGTGDSSRLRDTNQYACFQGWYLAEIAWLAIPDGFKVRARDPGPVYSGSWNAPRSFHIGRASSETGARATFADLHGSTIILAYVQKSSESHDTGAFRVQVDGQDWGGVFKTSLDFPLSTQTSISAPAALVITNLALANHTLAVTVVSASGSVELDWVCGLSTPAPTTWPHVFASNLPGQKHSSADMPYNNEQRLAALNQAVGLDCELLAGCGLNVTLIDVSHILNRETDLADSWHPNDAGHAKIKDAFRDPMKPFAGALRGKPSRTTKDSK